MNRYTVKTHNHMGLPDIVPVRIPLDENKEGSFAIMRAAFLGPNWQSPYLITRFELRAVKVHRTYIEVCVSYGPAAADGLRILESDITRRRGIRIHQSESGQITTIDGLHLRWSGDDILASCNSNTGAAPVGMEKGAGNRLVDTPPLITHKRRLVNLSPATQQSPSVSAPRRLLDDY